MQVYALTNSRLVSETLDLFLTREAAEAELREILEDEPEWVNLHAGEVRHGVKTVLGVHPNDAPEHRAIHAFGATFVVTDTRGLPLPSEFYGVLRVEEEEREAA